jgi:hypothetical protein
LLSLGALVLTPAMAAAPPPATPVIEAEGIGHTGYEEWFSAVDCPGEKLCIRPMAVVPNGRRLIVTHLSCEVSLGVVDGTQGLFVAHLRSAEHPGQAEYLPMTAQAGGPNKFGVNLMTNLIYEAGDRPEFVFQAFNTTAQRPGMGFSCLLVGYRVAA